MKSLSLLWRAGTAAVLLLVAVACQNTNDARQTTTVTGSYIPQDVQTNGPNYNGPSHFRSVDQSELNKTGASTVGQALRRAGAVP